jgi:hypothetical protein
MAPTAAMPAATPPTARPPTTTPIAVPDSESPTITTGRRMGEVAARAGVKTVPPGKKGRSLSPAIFGAAVFAAVLAVAVGVFIARRSGAPPSEGLVPAPTVAAEAPPTAPASSSTPLTPPAALAPSTAGPAVAVVEAQTAGAAPAAATATSATASAPPKRTRAKPTPDAAVNATPAPPAAVHSPAPAARRADLTVTIRRFLKINVSPSQARVFLDGNYIGISDDWDDAGGGSLLTFNLEGQHRIRICYPEHRDLLVDVVVRSTASDDKVTIEQELPKGTPDGPTSPDGNFHRPNYKTVGAVLFNVEPPDAIVSVNGKEYGAASKWARDEMIFRDMAVYQVVLSAPGYEPKTVRLMVAPTAGEIRATIKEKLKKQ